MSLCVPCCNVKLSDVESHAKMFTRLNREQLVEFELFLIVNLWQNDLKLNNFCGYLDRF